MDATIWGFSAVHQAGINIINSCNEQFPDNLYRHPVPHNYLDKDGLFTGSSEPITSFWLANKYYLLDNTIDQHRMIPLYNHIKDTNTSSGDEHPYGLKEAYAHYLKPYVGVWENQYWVDYAKIIWDSSKARQDKFKDFYYYKKYFFEKLKESYEAAKSLILEPQEELNQSTHLYQVGLFSQQKQPKTINAKDDLINDWVLIDKNDGDGNGSYQSHQKCNIM